MPVVDSALRDRRLNYHLLVNTTTDGMPSTIHILSQASQALWGPL